MFVALELKRDKKFNATPLQGHILDLINRSGGLGLVVNPDNWGKTLTALKALSEGIPYDRTNLGTDSK
jgi:superfamily II DNA or RNA helicase